MANSYTNPTYVKAAPHASKELQIGDSDPSLRADIINRVEKGLVANFKRLVNALFDGLTVDLSDQATTSAYDTTKLLTGIIDRDVTTTEVVSTAAETTVYSFSVPANTLSTNKMLRLTLVGDLLNNTGAGAGFTLRVKYGSTTIGTCAVTTWNSSVNRLPWDGLTVLAANNATNAQRSTTKLHGDTTSNALADGVGNAAAADYRYSGHNGIAEDSTLAKTLAVTIQPTANSASLSIKLFVALLELL